MQMVYVCTYREEEEQKNRVGSQPNLKDNPYHRDDIHSQRSAVESKEEESIHQGQVVNGPTRELEMTPPNLDNARYRTEYTDDYYGIWNQ